MTAVRIYGRTPAGLDVDIDAPGWMDREHREWIYRILALLCATPGPEVLPDRERRLAGLLTGEGQPAPQGVNEACVPEGCPPPPTPTEIVPAPDGCVATPSGVRRGDEPAGRAEPIPSAQPAPADPTPDNGDGVDRLVAMLDKAREEPPDLRVISIRPCDCGHVARLHDTGGRRRTGCPCDAYTAISSEGQAR